MAKRQPKIPNSHELQIHTKKLINEKTKLVAVKIPSQFPFNDLTCLEEHKKIFENLFNESNQL